MCTQLFQAGLAPTIITQLSGHTNINSLSTYATARDKQHQEMCAILHGNKAHLSIVSGNPIPAQADSSAAFPAIMAGQGHNPHMHMLS